MISFPSQKLLSEGFVLVNRCICGLLKNKCRILVTHQLQFLRTADQILVLREVCCAFLPAFLRVCLKVKSSSASVVVISPRRVTSWLREPSRSCRVPAWTWWRCWDKMKIRSIPDRLNRKKLRCTAREPISRTIPTVPTAACCRRTTSPTSFL